MQSFPREQKFVDFFMCIKYVMINCRSLSLRCIARDASTICLLTDSHTQRIHGLVPWCLHSDPRAYGLDMLLHFTGPLQHWQQQDMGTYMLRTQERCSLIFFICSLIWDWQLISSAIWPTWLFMAPAAPRNLYVSQLIHRISQCHTWSFCIPNSHLSQK